MTTERARQRSDTRTILAFFTAIAVVLVAFAAIVVANSLFFGL